MAFIKGHKKTGGKVKGSVNKLTEHNINAKNIVFVKMFYETLLGTIKGGLYYVYSHEYNGKCFYIGKGKNDRAWSNKRNELWVNYINSIDGKYDIKIIAADLTEDDALMIESALIISRKPICNIYYNNEQASLPL